MYFGEIALNGGDAGLLDIFRGGEIGLAGPEIQDDLALGLQLILDLHQFQGRRTGHGLNALRQLDHFFLRKVSFLSFRP